MVTGIEHTAIASPHPMKLAQWYVDHLDFTINYRPPGSRTVFLKAHDGSMIEIVESNAPPRPQAMRDPGFRHLALAVSDFDAVLARLQSKSVTFLTDRETVGGNTLIFFSDCDGNILHLLQREHPLP